MIAYISKYVLVAVRKGNTAVFVRQSFTLDLVAVVFCEFDDLAFYVIYDPLRFHDLLLLCLYSRCISVY